MTQIKSKIVFFSHKKLMRKTCCSLNYDVTILNYISLVEFYSRWIGQEIPKADSRYSCTIYEIRIPGGKTSQQAKDSFKIVKRFEKIGSVQWLLWGNLLIQLTLSLMNWRCHWWKRTSFWCTLIFVVFLK